MEDVFRLCRTPGLSADANKRALSLLDMVRPVRDGEPLLFVLLENYMFDVVWLRKASLPPQSRCGGVGRIVRDCPAPVTCVSGVVIVAHACCAATAAVMSVSCRRRARRCGQRRRAASLCSAITVTSWRCELLAHGMSRTSLAHCACAVLSGWG